LISISFRCRKTVGVVGGNTDKPQTKSLGAKSRPSLFNRKAKPYTDKMQYAYSLISLPTSILFLFSTLTR
jgi:hypothetical protein